LPLLASKSTLGLFASSATARQAAQRSKDAGLLRVLRSETKGKGTQEICGLTEKGLTLLLEEASPRPVLEAFIRSLEARERQATSLLENARATQEHLHSLKSVAEKVLERLHRPQVPHSAPVEKNGKHECDSASAILAHLARRQEASALDDCPLPELWRHARSSHPALTLGRFHDLLRRLHEEAKIYLHPWTGPLYELPEPACALLVGHEIAYYASLR